ncbi:VOC family protein [Paenibacillus sp. y28]|uniref:VOC family protein n=1 Tax=Paenibacillus sp. y28 TaxID=3129110 RepID=UPI0030187A9F
MGIQASNIFVNLPVKDLDKAVAFFTEIGFSFNPQFTNENATCMIVSDHIFVMLLVEPFFNSFTKKEIADTSKTAEVIMALSADSRTEVDGLVNKAIAAGGQAASEPMDHGFMYSRSFLDLDGHMWEFVYMDPASVQQQ